jgi:hypothetical protein
MARNMSSEVGGSTLPTGACQVHVHILEARDLKTKYAAVEETPLRAPPPDS